MANSNPVIFGLFHRAVARTASESRAVSKTLLQCSSPLCEKGVPNRHPNVLIDFSSLCQSSAAVERNIGALRSFVLIASMGPPQGSRRTQLRTFDSYINVRRSRLK
uniref:Uncharacterized protein n=1 Tax=Trichogramma kaykai TaxID=54128 RepID=A0ABD2WN12_9HYME